MYSAKRRFRLFRSPAFSGITTYDTLTLTRSNSSTDAFITKYTTTGRVAWAARISSTSTDISQSVATDSVGNIYVLGQYNATLSFFNTDGTPSAITLQSITSTTDVFLAKYSPLGQIQWATRIAGSGEEIPYKVIVDKSDNILVVGTFTSFPSVAIFNAPGTTSTISLDSNGTEQVFVVKYNSSGIALWATRMSGSSVQTGKSIVTDASDNIYVLGEYTSNPLTIYNAGGGGTSLTLPNTGGSTQGFIVKYNSSGTSVWATRINGVGGAANTNDIVIDGANNLCLVGSFFSSRLDFINVGGGITLTSLFKTGSQSTFIVKYTSDGIGVWAALITSDVLVEPAALAVDSSNNIVLITTDVSNDQQYKVYNAGGTTTTLSSLPSTLRRIVVVKYDSSGIAQWRGYLDSNTGGQRFARGISTDTSGDIYVTGQFSTAVRAFDKNNTGAFSEILSTNDSTDVVLAKYSASGIPQWITSMQGSGFDRPLDITTHNPDNVLIISGAYTSTPLTLRSVGF